MKKRILAIVAAVVVAAAAVVSLTACGQQESSSSAPASSTASAVKELVHDVDFIIDLPYELKKVAIPEGMAEEFNTVAFYKSADGLHLEVDAFEIDELPDEYKGAKDLKSFTEIDAKKYGGKDIKTGKVDGIEYTCYTHPWEEDGIKYTYVVYTFENDGYYIQLCFGNGEEDITAEAQKIIDTIEKTEKTTIPLTKNGSYTIELPATLFEVVVTAQERELYHTTAEYMNTDGLEMYIDVFDSKSLPEGYKDVTDLKSFTEADMNLYHGKDMQTGKVNGIDYTVHTNLWTDDEGNVGTYLVYSFKDGDYYVQLLFTNGTKNVSKEAEAIVNSIAKK